MSIETELKAFEPVAGVIDPKRRLERRNGDYKGTPWEWYCHDIGNPVTQEVALAIRKEQAREWLRNVLSGMRKELGDFNVYDEVQEGRCRAALVWGRTEHHGTKLLFSFEAETEACALAGLVLMVRAKWDVNHQIGTWALSTFFEKYAATIKKLVALDKEQE